MCTLCKRGNSYGSLYPHIKHIEMLILLSTGEMSKHPFIRSLNVSLEDNMIDTTTVQFFYRGLLWKSH